MDSNITCRDPFIRYDVLMYIILVGLWIWIPLNIWFWSRESLKVVARLIYNLVVLTDYTKPADNQESTDDEPTSPTPECRTPSPEEKKTN